MSYSLLIKLGLYLLITIIIISSSSSGNSKNAGIKYKKLSFILNRGIHINFISLVHTTVNSANFGNSLADVKGFLFHIIKRVMVTINH